MTEQPQTGSTSPAGSPEAPAPPPARRRRHWRRWVLLGVSACVAYAGYYSYTRLTYRPTPRPDYWAARIAALDPAPPGAMTEALVREILKQKPWMQEDDADPTGTNGSADEINAQQTDLYNASEGWIISHNSLMALLNDPLPGNPLLQSDHWKKVHTLFASKSYQAARDELFAAAKRGWQCPPDLDSTSEWTLSSYRDESDWVLWLLLNAKSACLIDSDPSTAIECWTTVIRISRQQIRCWPIGVSQLACLHWTQLTDQLIQMASLSRGSLDSRAFASNVNDALGPLPEAAALLEPMRLMGMYELEKRYVREKGDWIDVTAMAGFSESPWGGPIPTPPSRLWNLTSFVFHDLETAQQRVNQSIANWHTMQGLGLMTPDHKASLELVHQTYLYTQQPYNTSRMRLIEATSFVRSGAGLLDGFPIRHGWAFAPGLALCEIYFHRTYLEAALAVLALERYQHDHGRYPIALDALIPDYLPALPIDYADRQPLRYRRDNQQCVLYSIGRDGQDNNGRGQLVINRVDSYMPVGVNPELNTQSNDLVFWRSEKQP